MSTTTRLLLQKLVAGASTRANLISYWNSNADILDALCKASGLSGGQTVYGGTGSGEYLVLHSTSNATKGKIFLGNDSAYDEANARLGVGIANPMHTLEVLDIMSIRRCSDNTSSGGLLLYKGRGSINSPTAVQSGDGLGAIEAFGYGTSGYLLGGYISFTAAENFNTVCGTHIKFFVTAAGASSPTERMRLFASGGLTLGSTSDPGAGNFYAAGNVSALSFTDRTLAFVGDALAAIDRIRAYANGELDHASLPEFAADCYCDEQGEWWPGRSIGDMVSVLVAWAQQFREKVEKEIAVRDAKIELLEARLAAIEARLNA